VSSELFFQVPFALPILSLTPSQNLLLLATLEVHLHSHLQILLVYLHSSIHITDTMAARITPKMASLMGSTSAKVARPMVRSNLGAQRAFSGMTKSNTAFQTIKRQQASSILSKTTTSFSAARRPYSSEMANALVQVSQNLGMGGAAIGLAGAGVGIGLVFAALLQAVARNPSMRGQLFSYAILGFAFVEAIGLFDLMVAMMAKFL
jgi:F-type H+-transporting ATPase subunit c